MAKIQKGCILLADISGYTRIVTSMALEHSGGVVNNIFKKMYAATLKGYDVKEIEGDAIFAISTITDKGKLFTKTLEQIERYANTFYSVKEEIRKNPPDCRCEFCANFGTVSIKFIVHYGEFSIDMIGPIKSIVGKDIVLAHRLLKNSVQGKSYVLMTEDFLKLDKSYDKGFEDAHVENVEYFGDVRVGVKQFEWSGKTKGKFLTYPSKKGVLGLFGKN